MVDLYFLLQLIFYLILISNIIVIIIIFWEIISGSFQRYIEMRRKHIQRFEKIEKKLGD